MQFRRSPVQPQRDLPAPKGTVPFSWNENRDSPRVTFPKGTVPFLLTQKSGQSPRTALSRPLLHERRARGIRKIVRATLISRPRWPFSRQLSVDSFQTLTGGPLIPKGEAVHVFFVFFCMRKKATPTVGKAVCTIRRRKRQITKTKSSRLANLANYQENRHGYDARGRRDEGRHCRPADE